MQKGNDMQISSEAIKKEMEKHEQDMLSVEKQFETALDTKMKEIDNICAEGETPADDDATIKNPDAEADETTDEMLAWFSGESETLSDIVATYEKKEINGLLDDDDNLIDEAPIFTESVIADSEPQEPMFEIDVAEIDEKEEEDSGVVFELTFDDVIDEGEDAVSPLLSVPTTSVKDIDHEDFFEGLGVEVIDEEDEESFSEIEIEVDSEPAEASNKTEPRQPISWDEYFMAVARLAAMRSKDPNTQVGACIVSNDNRILSIGYNGAPNRYEDAEFPWAREGEPLNTKYMYVVHAEENAVLNFRGSRRDMEGAKVYVDLFPCNECAKMLVQAGIREVIYLSDKYADTDSTIASKHIFDVCGVTYRKLELTSGLDELVVPLTTAM